MSNLEPIEEGDLDLEHKFKVDEKPQIGLDKEPVKIEKETPQEIVAAEKDNAYSRILSKVKQHQPQDGGQSDIQDDAANVYGKTDAESQIQHLVDIALTKGIIHAVKVARHLEDNYVLDMFHDRILADELHDALVKKGLLKEI
jgi:hypothetical protein